MIAAGQAGGDVGKAVSVGNVEKGEIRPVGNALGEGRPQRMAREQRRQYVSRSEFRTGRQRRERLGSESDP